MLRRSRSYLNIRTDEQIDAPATQGNIPPRIPIAMRLRTGTAIKSPKNSCSRRGDVVHRLTMNDYVRVAHDCLYYIIIILILM